MTQHRATDGGQRRADDEGGHIDARWIDAHEQCPLWILLDRPHCLALPGVLQKEVEGDGERRAERRGEQALFGDEHTANVQTPGTVGGIAIGSGPKNAQDADRIANDAPMPTMKQFKIS